jgi:hypothetical protein
VRDDDTENFAHGDIVSSVPTGVGIMVLAANEVEIHHNEVRGNDSAGVVVASYSTAEVLGAPAPIDGL